MLFDSLQINNSSVWILLCLVTLFPTSTLDCHKCGDKSFTWLLRSRDFSYWDTAVWSRKSTALCQSCHFVYLLRPSCHFSSEQLYGSSQFFAWMYRTARCIVAYIITKTSSFINYRNQELWFLYNGVWFCCQ